MVAARWACRAVPRRPGGADMNAVGRAAASVGRACSVGGWQAVAEASCSSGSAGPALQHLQRRGANAVAATRSTAVQESMSESIAAVTKALLVDTLALVRIYVLQEKGSCLGAGFRQEPDRPTLVTSRFHSREFK